MNALRVSVPPRFRKVFWRYAPVPGGLQWWFERDPGCAEGDPIVFTADRKIVAEATIARVRRSGRKATITWREFEDLRDEDEVGFVPNIYGEYSA